MVSSREDSTIFWTQIKLNAEICRQGLQPIMAGLEQVTGSTVPHTSQISAQLNELTIPSLWPISITSTAVRIRGIVPGNLGNAFKR